VRTNFTIFLLFFGIAALDAVRGGDLKRVLFWAVIALFFLWADKPWMTRPGPRQPNAGGSR